jgi:hypothetical protein
MVANAAMAAFFRCRYGLAVFGRRAYLRYGRVAPRLVAGAFTRGSGDPVRPAHRYREWNGFHPNP